MIADLLIVNGRVLTMNPAQPTASALAVKDGKLVAVGSNAHVRSFRGPRTAVISAVGKTVLPGFIDAHTHFMQTGLNRLALDLTEVRTIEEIVSLVRARAEETAPGNWILGHGFDDSVLCEGRFPTAAELDDASAAHPVILTRRDHHSSVVNSAAWNILGIPAGTPGVEMDVRTGQPTGVLRAEANGLAREAVFRRLDGATREKGMRLAARLAVARGITTVHALEGASWFGEENALFLWKNAASLPLRVVLYYQTTAVEQVLKMGLPRIGGCILVDGSFGSRTAALSEPFADDPSTSGRLYFRDEELESFVVRAHRAGLQVALHCIGDRAIGQALRAYARALREYPRPDHRHRIEHCELPDDSHITETGKMGIVLSMQPAFEHLWGGPGRMYARRLGEERRKRTNPLRAILDAGITVAGGSDSDVTPMGPMLGVGAAVNHPTEQHRVQLPEALAMFTLGGARAAFEEREKGSLEVGKRADVVILDEDICAVDLNCLHRVGVRTTIVGGTVVYQAR